MISKRHKLFNIAIIVIPWLSVLFLGKRSLKRYSIAGFVIVIFEIINHIIGYKRNWWHFYGKPKSFLTNELPFTLGPYMPLSLWLLKFSYGNFKKFLMLNLLSDGTFAFIIMAILKKWRIIALNRLSYFQFFLYIFYKAFILYGVQYWLENKTSFNKYMKKNKL